MNIRKFVKNLSKESKLQYLFVAYCLDTSKVKENLVLNFILTDIDRMIIHQLDERKYKISKDKVMKISMNLAKFGLIIRKELVSDTKGYELRIQ